MSLQRINDTNRSSAMTGFSQLSSLESQRKNYNESVDDAEDAKQASAITSGITIGVMTGNPFIGIGVAVMGMLL